MHHLVLDVVDLGLATEFVIARCVLAISPDTLYVPQFSGWCDLDPLNYKSSASSSEGNATAAFYTAKKSRQQIQMPSIG